MYVINTADEFRELRKTLKPAVIESKRHGTIVVPCTVTLIVNRQIVVANNYNPNFVSKDKMRLLKQSIIDNGFCFPIVTIWDDDEGRFVIIDGFHRNSMGNPEWLDMDYIPLVFVNHDISKRMYATVQFNKARGVHQVDLDADVIRSLLEQGKTEAEISDHLEIDLETIHRYKQLTGISEIFKNSEWSMPWTTQEILSGDSNG